MNSQYGFIRNDVIDAPVMLKKVVIKDRLLYHYVPAIVKCWFDSIAWTCFLYEFQKCKLNIPRTKNERFTVKSEWTIRDSPDFVFSINILCNPKPSLQGIKISLDLAITYLWGILGQWDILLLNLTSIDFTKRHLDKIRETNGGKIKEQDIPLT